MFNTMNAGKAMTIGLSDKQQFVTCLIYWQECSQSILILTDFLLLP